MSLIRCERVHKKFERFGQTSHALSDIDVSIDSGESVGFLGKSGSGKSTLIRCLLKIEGLTNGEIFFEGKAFSTFSSEEVYSFRQKTAWISQDHHLLSSKTVFENVALPLRLQNLEESEINERVLALLEYLGIDDKSQSYPSQLSGGQQQRVSIGRALIKKPVLLFCDELTSALDEQSAASIMDLLVRLKNEFSLTVVLVTHNESLASKFCQRIVRLAEGKIIEDKKMIRPKVVVC